MTYLTITLTIWIPVFLGVAIGYLVPQMLTQRAALPDAPEPPGKPVA